MMTKYSIPAFLVAALVALSPLSAKVRPVKKAQQTESGVITKAADGDTVFVKPEHGPEVKVRLHYADAPEVAHNTNEQDQPGGREALDYVKANWEGKHVTYTQHGVSYGRPIVDVVDKDTGKNLALDLVQLGLAEVDPRFHPPQAFKDAQAAALEKRLGVFKDTTTPVAPWDWRKQSRAKK